MQVTMVAGTGTIYTCTLVNVFPCHCHLLDFSLLSHQYLRPKKGTLKRIIADLPLFKNMFLLKLFIIIIV